MEKPLLSSFANHEQNGVAAAPPGRPLGVPKTVTESKGVRATAVTPLRQCVACYADVHVITSCSAFSGMNMIERLAIIRDGRLFIRCFKPGHLKQNCRSMRKCLVNGCRKSHHPLLHGAPRIYPVGLVNRDLPPAEIQELANVSVYSAAVSIQASSYHVLCAVGPVMVTFGFNTCQTFALLDSGAEVSVMSEVLSRKLKMTGAKRALSIRTISGVSQVTAVESKCIISAEEGSNSFQMDPVIVVQKLNLAFCCSSRKGIKSKWFHFADLPLYDVTDEDVVLLIEMNVPLAHRHYDIRIPQPGSCGPVSVRTPFRWTVVGRVPDIEQCLEPNVDHISIMCHHCTPFSEVDQLNREIERFWAIKSYGHPVEEKHSPGNKVAMDMLHRSIHFTGGRYEVRMLWKSPNIKLPDNRAMIWRRFCRSER